MTIGGPNAQVQWAGLVSGLHQLNVQIPNVGAGDQPIQTSVSAGVQPECTFRLEKTESTIPGSVLRA